MDILKDNDLKSFDENTPILGFSVRCSQPSLIVYKITEIFEEEILPETYLNQALLANASKNIGVTYFDLAPEANSMKKIIMNNLKADTKYFYYMFCSNLAELNSKFKSGNYITPKNGGKLIKLHLYVNGTLFNSEESRICCFLSIYFSIPTTK